MVAITAEIMAMISVVYNAFIIELFTNNDLYQSNVNPDHTVRLLVLLNENMMRMKIGAYRKINISAV